MVSSSKHFNRWFFISNWWLVGLGLWAMAVPYKMANSLQSVPPTCFSHSIVFTSLLENKLGIISWHVWSSERYRESYTWTSLQPTVEAIIERSGNGLSVVCLPQIYQSFSCAVEVLTTISNFSLRLAFQMLCYLWYPQTIASTTQLLSPSITDLYTYINKGSGFNNINPRKWNHENNWNSNSEKMYSLPSQILICFVGRESGPQIVMI